MSRVLRYLTKEVIVMMVLMLIMMMTMLMVIMMMFTTMMMIELELLHPFTSEGECVGLILLP